MATDTMIGYQSNSVYDRLIEGGVTPGQAARCQAIFYAWFNGGDWKQGLKVSTQYRYAALLREHCGIDLRRPCKVAKSATSIKPVVGDARPGCRFYYAIKPTLPGRASITLHYQDEHDEIYLGPHVRLSGMSGMAHIESRELAEEFAEACVPRLQKRYGAETRVEVVQCRATSTKALAKRIEKDTHIVKQRLATGNLAPNKPV